MILGYVQTFPMTFSRHFLSPTPAASPLPPWSRWLGSPIPSASSSSAGARLRYWPHMAPYDIIYGLHMYTCICLYIYIYVCVCVCVPMCVHDAELTSGDPTCFLNSDDPCFSVLIGKHPWERFCWIFMCLFHCVT